MYKLPSLKFLKKNLKNVILVIVFILLWSSLYFGSALSEVYPTLILTVSLVELVLLFNSFEQRQFKIAWTLTVITILVSLYGSSLAFEENYCWNVGDTVGFEPNESRLIPATPEEKQAGFTEVTPIFRAHMNCHKTFNLISALQQTIHKNN